MFVQCSCGATNSAFNPKCAACGAAVVERAPPTVRDTRPPVSEPRSPGGPPSAPIASGSVVGDYHIESLLGSGATGSVYRAIRKSDGAAVALKRLHAHVLSAKDARARFVREARALENVQSPWVGRILDAFETDHAPVIVMELHAGRSLRALIDATGPLPDGIVLAIARQLCEALRAIHAAGWVHRDVKPENVMVLETQNAGLEIRLLDFGLVRPVSSPSEALTAAGAFVGSLAYAAPEQILGEAVGPWTDHWALGVVAYEMLSGTRPFQAPSRSSLAMSILKKPAPALNATPALAAWVEALLQRDPKQRLDDPGSSLPR